MVDWSSCAVSHRTPSPSAQPVSGPWAMVVPTQSNPPAERTDVSVGTTFDAVAGSNDPPPVSRTTPVGNPLAVPLKPKPARPPALKAGPAAPVASLHASVSATPSSGSRDTGVSSFMDNLLISRGCGSDASHAASLGHKVIGGLPRQTSVASPTSRRDYPNVSVSVRTTWQTTAVAGGGRSAGRFRPRPGGGPCCRRGRLGHRGNRCAGVPCAMPLPSSPTMPLPRLRMGLAIAGILAAGVLVGVALGRRQVADLPPAVDPPPLATVPGDSGAVR